MATKRSKRDLDAYMTRMRGRFETAQKGWSTVRKDFREDLRYVCGDPSQQWDPTIKANRDDDGIPALTMDRLNPLVLSIVNKSRQDRPQPRVEPGDDGDPQTAEVIEGKMRHVLYVSHADVAFDCAEAYCASGGLGFYKIVKEYTGKHSTNQEPRVKRISDPMSEFPDPAVEEADFSDAKFWFSRKKYPRGDYKAEFGSEPVAFPFPDDPAGNWYPDDENVWVAEYWWVEEIPQEYHVLADGRRGVADELMEERPYTAEEVIQARKVKERIIHCDIVDGHGVLEESVWEGEYIPRFVVTGPERIHEGKRRYLSAVRYARDPQTLLNAAGSDMADRMAIVNKAQWVGLKGQFKDKKWRDGKRHFYLEVDPPSGQAQGQQIPIPQHNQTEPQIQGALQASMAAADALKGAMGYVDSITRPSQADISGVATQRRENQQSLANFHFEDSLVQSMWHFGRALVDLLIVLADTPRVWQTRKEDGRKKAVPITVDVDEGYSPFVQGHDPQQHVKVDDGTYGVVVYTGPAQATRNHEEAAFLEGMFARNPQLFAMYGDLYFRKRGWADFEERAKLTLPPAVQQAMAAQDGQISPQALAAQAGQLQAQNQQLKSVLQQVMAKLETKQIETQGKLDVEKLKTIRALIESSIDNQHDATKELTAHNFGAVQHVLDMLQPAPAAVPPAGQGGGQVQ